MERQSDIHRIGFISRRFGLDMVAKRKIIALPAPPPPKKGHPICIQDLQNKQNACYPIHSNGDTGMLPNVT
jgi:hypothetical protein